MISRKGRTPRLSLPTNVGFQFTHEGLHHIGIHNLESSMHPETTHTGLDTQDLVGLDSIPGLINHYLGVNPNMQDNVLAHDWSIIPGLINHNPRINPIMQGYVLAHD